MSELTPDQIENAFRKVRETFADEVRLRPGSATVSPDQLERRMSKVIEESLEPDWRDIHEDFMVGGMGQRMYPISALAMALERAVGIMRRWESRGYLPKAPFRRLNDSPRGRHRFYTEAHIEGLESIAREEGLLRGAKQRKLHVGQTRFPERAHELFRQLKESQD
ncbi:hypothetical protein [Streptomyces sp. NBC_00470]|uniref:hypothetical protein n=1 Tax=Streptomyces sp. NBC_00470 TaxID=2975753 RepID=UPI0030E503D3